MRENVYKDEGLQNYLQEIARTKTLNREEERYLAKKAKKGDKEAVQKLIESNLKFVVKIASKYQNRGLSLAELISEGNVGLIKAIEKFDPDKDIKLISYAVWWIRQRILFALAEKTNLIRTPLGQANLYTKIRNAQEKIRTELGEEPTTEDIAEKTDLTQDNVRKMQMKKHETVSLDHSSTYDGGNAFNLLDILSDPSSLDPKTIYYRDKTKKRIRDSIENLDERSAKITRTYFGLDGNESKNFAEIAQELGLSRERIRQIQKDALSKILKDIKDDISDDIDIILNKGKQ